MALPKPPQKMVIEQPVNGKCPRCQGLLWLDSDLEVYPKGRTAWVDYEVCINCGWRARA